MIDYGDYPYQHHGSAVLISANSLSTTAAQVAQTTVLFTFEFFHVTASRNVGRKSVQSRTRLKNEQESAFLFVFS